jgi:hypothetical protein
LGEDYLNCLIYTIKKPANVSHNNTRTKVKTFIRGYTVNSSEITGVPVPICGLGVIVAVDVLVAGKTSVMAGNGINVVVGDKEAMDEGVNVCPGVNAVPTVD